ncbi:MAG TPA: beta galactosidase jelly roll domain-containing protein, partial [Nitrospira sp.]|nr:beta galactosidase jelly roll domain-containing protein [Nitrospira sp.]
MSAWVFAPFAHSWTNVRLAPVSRESGPAAYGQIPLFARSGAVPWRWEMLLLAVMVQRVVRRAKKSFAVAFAVVAAANTRSIAAPANVRATIELSSGWRFIQSDAISNAEGVNYPHTDWATVSVPHTWNRVGYYKPNPEQHINTADSVNKVQGIGWYRLKFRSPSASGKKAWLEFDAASRVADVWLNGNKVGEHRGGFSRFRLNVTPYLVPGGSNLLAVRVDNTQPEPGASTSDTLPLVGDFFVHGGLYRPVRLILTDPVHIDMMDFGGPGIYARTTSVDPQGADVRVIAKVVDDSGRSANVSVAVTLMDRLGRTAAKSVRHLAWGAGLESTAFQLRVPHAHLWQGVADPYLYTLRAEVTDGHGVVLDRLDQPFGIRVMRLDPNLGFFLNGKPLHLHGVGLHQDYEG